MATDFGEKEREFIDGLKENTGRDLGEWMQAIADAGLPHRNDIIDWLRRKGLMFSKASWLERIHHNGGKPIYADAPRDAAPRRPVQRRREERLGSHSTLLPAALAPSAPRPEPAIITAPLSPVPPAKGDLDALLATAKAYRPLAQLVLAKIRQAAPAAPLAMRESSVVIGERPFAILGISARELRLHLALGDQPFDEVVKKGQAGGGLGKSEALSHMLVLKDARQVDARLLELIALAAT